MNYQHQEQNSQNKYKPEKSKIDILRWKGGIKVFPFISMSQRQHDKKKVEALIGYELGDDTVIHHHTDRTLVVCEDWNYHWLLHTRTKALLACGHTDWRKCTFCREHDNPDNLWISKNGKQAYHRSCRNEYIRVRRSKYMLHTKYLQFVP